jgi:amidase
MPAVAVTEVLRAQSFALSLGQHLKKHRDKLKPEVVWNIKKGFGLTVAQVA